MPAQPIFDVIGWAGAFLYLYAYLFLARHLRERRHLYVGLNALAALAVATVSLAKGTPQAVVLNLGWFGISLLSYRGALPGLGHRLAMAFRVVALTWAGAAAVMLASQMWAVGISTLAWLGTTCFLASYLLFASLRITYLEFNAWNLFAPAALLPRLIADENWPVVGLESFWCIAAAYALLRARLAGPHDSPSSPP